MSNKVTRTEGTDTHPVSVDKTEGGRYSVLGPDPTKADGVAIAWDHEAGEELGRGSREAMIRLISEAPDDRLSRWEDYQK